MKLVLLLILFTFSSISMADDIIKSMRSIMHEENGNIYISSAREDNHTKNAEKLNALWLSKKEIAYHDSYQQNWKTVEIKELSFNDGSDAKHFIIYYKNEFSRATTKSASLFEWGCDNSIIPILNIGKWPFKKKPYEWGGLAIEVAAEYGLPTIISKDAKTLSTIPEISKMLTHYDKATTTEFYWKKLPNLRIIHVEYPTPRKMIHELFIYNTVTKKLKTLEEITPFDVMC